MMRDRCRSRRLLSQVDESTWTCTHPALADRTHSYGMMAIDFGISLKVANDAANTANTANAMKKMARINGEYVVGAETLPADVNEARKYMEEVAKARARPAQQYLAAPTGIHPWATPF